VSKRSNAKASDSNFDTWLEGSATQGPAWKNLPEPAREEIAKVIDFNHEHPLRSVSQQAVLKRLEEVYHVKISRSALGYYVTSVLGRNWKRE